MTGINQNIIVMKNCLLLVLFYCFSLGLNGLNAQTSGSLVETNRVNGVGNNRSNQIMMTLKKDYSDVKAEGSPYLVENFVEGIIIIENKTESKAFLRYNAYLDNIEVREGTKDFNLKKSEEIKVKLSDRIFSLKEYPEGRGFKTGYLVTLSEGPIGFYMKPGKRYISGKEPKSGYDSYQPSKFVDNYRYFISKNDLPLQEVQLSRQLSKELFGKNYGQVMEYAKKNDLNKKNPEDLATLIKWYNDQ